MVLNRIVLVAMLAGIISMPALSFAGIFQIRTAPGSLFRMAGMHYEPDGHGNYIVRAESGARGRPNSFGKGTTYSKNELLRLVESQNLTHNNHCIDQLRQFR